MNGLRMKYFVLKPTKDNDYGYASMNAISEYAFCIKDENPQLAKDLTRWMDDIRSSREKGGREDG